MVEIRDEETACRYLATFRRAAKAYSQRVLKKKTITIRVGRALGKTVSSRVQIVLNTKTDRYCVSCALFFSDNAIYPTKQHRRTCKDLMERNAKDSLDSEQEKSRFKRYTKEMIR